MFGCLFWCWLSVVGPLLGQARIFSLLFEFIQGDLCLSAHTAPIPVQKKITIVPERAVSAKWQSITGSHSGGELSSDEPVGSMGGLLP